MKSPFTARPDETGCEKGTVCISPVPTEDGSSKNLKPTKIGRLCKKEIQIYSYRYWQSNMFWAFNTDSHERNVYSEFLYMVNKPTGTEL